MMPATPSAAPAATTLGEKLEFDVVTLSAEHAVLAMPVEGNVQPAGVLHGGATAALCEEAASRSAGEHARIQGKIAVGGSISVTHLRPVLAGVVTATAHAQHLGRTTTVHEVKVTDIEGRLIAVALVTNHVIDPL